MTQFPYRFSVRAVRSVVLATSLLCMPTVSSAVTDELTWNNDSNPYEWNTPGAWAFGQVPHDTFSTSYRVYLLAANAQVNGLHTIGRLDVDSNSTLTVNTPFSNSFTVSDDGTLPSEPNAVNNRGTINISAGAYMKSSYLSTSQPAYTTTFRNQSQVNMLGSDASAATLTVKGILKNESGAIITLSDADSSNSGGNQIWGYKDQSGSITPGIVNDGLIRGAGKINGMEIVNNGIIEANGNNALILDRGFTSYVPAPVNQGIYKATGSGGLVFSSGTWTNFNGGSIQVASSQLTIASQNTTITGGTVDMSGTSSTLNLDQASTNNFNIVNTATPVTINSLNGTPTVNGTFDNYGSASLNTSLNIGGTVTNHTGGILDVSANKALTASGVTNQSQVNVANGGSLVMSSGSNYSQTAGQTSMVNGTISVSGGGEINISGGSVVGSGTLSGPVNVSGTGSIAPGFSPGTIVIDGPFSMLGGTLNMEIGGINPGEYDQLLIINGLASFTGGEVHMNFINGFTPDSISSFQLFSFLGGLSGAPNVVADGFNVIGDGQGGFSFITATSVPEPSTAVLIALSGLAALRRGTKRAMRSIHPSTLFV